MAARSLSLREKRLIQVAILLVIVVLLSLLLRGGGGVPPSQPVGPVPPPTPTPIPATIPGPVAAAPAPAPVPAAELSQLRLHGLLASGAVGLANGLLIAVAGMPPFVITLGMMSIVRSLALV